MEVRVTLGTLLERYDLVPTTPRIARQVRRGITLVPRDGARVRVVAREPRRSPGAG
jgi:cytochrome P450